LLIAFTGLVVLCVAEELFSPFENEMEEGIEID